MTKSPLAVLEPWTNLWHEMFLGALKVQRDMLRGLPIPSPVFDPEANKKPSTVIMSPVTFIVNIG